MDENRAQAYANLIQQLLSCTNGEEPQILQANSELLDAEFLMVCQVIAENLAEEGQENAADFLRNLASKLGEFLGFTSSRGNNADNNYPRDYLDFLQLLVQTEEDNFGDNSYHIYTVLQANIDKINPNLISILRTTMAGSLIERNSPEQTEKFAALIENIAIKLNKFPRGNRAENIEIAIAAYEIVLSVRTFENNPEGWAKTQNNLANAYSVTIRGDKAQNIEKAIFCYQEALKVRTRDAFPKDWATTTNNFAAAYYNRVNGNKADNIEQAIKLFKTALEIRTRNNYPQEWAETNHNLGEAYRQRIREDRGENIEQAITFYNAALEVNTRYDFPERWAETQNNLGEAYRERIRGKREENIEQAITFYNAALEVHTREAFPEYWATTQNNLAIAYCQRIRGEKAENIEMAIASYHNSLTISTREAFPQNHTETLYNLGHIYQINKQWQLAYDTYAAAIETVEFLRGEIHSGDESKQKLAEEYNIIYRNMVEVCLKLKNYTKAIEYVERSKARNLVELFANRDIKPKGDIPETVINELSRLRREIDAEQRRVEIEQTNRNSNYGTISGERSLQIDRLQTTSRDSTNLTQLRQQLDELLVRDIQPIDPDFLLTQKVNPILYSDIQALTAENTAIIQYYILGDKFLTFIITSQSPTPIVWESSTEDFEALVNWDNEYQKDYKESKPQWKQKLASRLQNLAEILHLDRILKNIPKPCDRLILIPHRFLHLFPLHALPVSQETWLQFNPNSDSSPPNPYLLDCFVGGVSYAPSCQLLQQAKQRERPNFSHLFAIANPTKDRYLLELQAANIRHKFKSNDFLAKDDANKNAILNAKLSFANCAHFGCHGEFEPDSPLESSLVFANKERLTLLEILNLDLNQCRLVTLSACETGLTESKTSDEYIGLPFGFLLAGSPSMVTTLWKVD
ncbi:MAG: CHAT domain-containing protein [Microcoleus sp. PH2017_22_RUC_O_B]|nr:CHAT domain-containing protein [Microcoleus sp. PH2017_21_RUC_O_A]MCC3543207.1 CHAT domain-containing protein [Microcoleus sp. PH2017_22_RUC_O_B]